MPGLLVSPGKPLTSFLEGGRPPWAHRAAVYHGRFEGLVGQVEMSGSAKPQTNWIYVGYRFTVFSNGEEEMAKGRLGGDAMKVYSHDGSPGGRTVWLG